jgi:hypothetical protein
MIYVQGSNGESCDVCNGGEVKATETSITCICPEGYSGELCENRPTPASTDCTNLWTLYKDKRAPQRTKQKGINTELLCKKACIDNVNCKVVDFEYNDDSCYLGFVSGQQLQTSDNTRHWFLQRSSCNNCLYTWNYYPGQRVQDPDSKVIDGVTQEQCKTACLDDPKCIHASYYIKTNKCFMGNNPTNMLQDFESANNWHLVRNCDY